MTTTLDAIPATTSDLPATVAARVEEDGYAIVTGVFDDEAAALVDEVQRVEAEHSVAEGTNEFEGHHTRRTFDLIGKSEPFRLLTIHDIVLPIAEAILGPDLLLSGTTSMNIGPGETPQLLHSDDGMITLPRPHVATMLTTMWALTDFRADNGGTHVVPKSHLQPNTPKPGERHDDEVVEIEMPAGSVCMIHGSTWHGGGKNQTADERRYGLSIQYVAGWCRQQQNLMLGTPREVAAGYPQRLQELIGYSMFANVMGHVDRQHPRTLLGVDAPLDTAWERMKR